MRLFTRNTNLSTLQLQKLGYQKLIVIKRWNYFFNDKFESRAKCKSVSFKSRSTTRHCHKSWHLCEYFKRKRLLYQNHSLSKLSMKLLLLIICLVHFVMSKPIFKNKHSRYRYNKYLQLHKVRKWVKRYLFIKPAWLVRIDKYT